MRYGYYRCKMCGHINKVPLSGVSNENKLVSCIRCGYSAPFFEWKPYKVAKTGKSRKKRRR